MNFTPQQEAAQMFFTEQAAEVITLDNLTTHNVPAGLTFNTDLDSLLDVTWKHFAAGDYEQAKQSARNLADEAGRQKNTKMLIEGEYYLIRASARLGDLTAAPIEQILVHKEKAADKSHLAELNYQLAAFRTGQGRTTEALKALQTAKKYVSKEQDWKDDILFLEAQLVKKSDPIRAADLYKEVLLGYPHGGEGDFGLLPSEQSVLSQKYKPLFKKGETFDIGRPSLYCLESCKALMQITENLSKTKSSQHKLKAKDIAEWFIDNTGKSPLLNQHQKDWAKGIYNSVLAWKRTRKTIGKSIGKAVGSAFSYLKSYDMKSFNHWGDLVFPIQALSGAYSTRTGIDFTLINMVGKFDNDTKFMHGRGNKDSFNFGGVKVKTIGHDSFRDFMHELDLTLMDIWNFDYKDKYPTSDLDASYVGTSHGLKGRQKLGRFYIEAGFEFGGIGTSEWIQYKQFEDGSYKYWTLLDGEQSELDIEGNRRLLEELHSQITDNSSMAGDRRIFFQGFDNFNYTFGIGLHNLIFDEDLGLGINYVGISLDDSKTHIGTEVVGRKNGSYKNTLLDVDSGLKFQDLWIKGEVDLVNKQNFSIALMGQIPISNRQEDVYGLDIWTEFSKAQQVRGIYGINAQGIIKVSDTSGILLKAAYMIEKDGLGEFHDNLMFQTGFVSQWGGAK